MDAEPIANERLAASRLVGPPLATPADLVAWFGAVQAQDYRGAKWGVAQRLDGVTDSDLDRAFDEGRILRTHVLRPTWHFVLPQDIRWLLELTAPRVHLANRTYYRRLELDAATFARSHDLLVAGLEGGRALTRAELAALYSGAGLDAGGLRHGYLLIEAELEGLICSGPRRGRQQTYMLLDERVPTAAPRTREDALRS